MAKLKFEFALLMKLDEKTIQEIKNHEIPEDPKGTKVVRLSDVDLHVTLTSGKSAKPHSEIISEKLPQDVKFPEVKIKEYRFCYRPNMDKTSYVAFIENQDEFKIFVDELYKSMGLENPEPDRLFHITVANNVPKEDDTSVANPFDSIGNINIQDLKESTQNTINKYQVWFDMDGVLVDFEGGLKNNADLNGAKRRLDELIDAKYSQLKGLSTDELKSQVKEMTKNTQDPELKNLKKIFYAYNNLVYSIAEKPGFFASLKMLPGAIEMLDAAKSITGLIPNILTAPMGNENDPDNHCVIEKKKWCEENLSGKFNHIEVTIDKGRVVKSRFDVLIDDRKKYLDKFTSAGGIGILHKTPNNFDTETYKDTIQKLKKICSVNERVKIITTFSEYRKK
jgi:5'(3')-deoxyribonucleotidase